MILRPDYIEALKPYIDPPLVKILSGVRRCGKSTILMMLADELRARGVSSECIIERRYNEMKYDGFTAKEMYRDLMDVLTGKDRCYLLLDEVQEIDGWEKVLNDLLDQNAADLYVTGSNSKLMSAEIETYLTGRYVSIPVYTLSFREYLTFRGKGNADAAAFDEYLQYAAFDFLNIEFENCIITEAEDVRDEGQLVRYQNQPEKTCCGEYRKPAGNTCFNDHDCSKKRADQK